MVPVRDFQLVDKIFPGMPGDSLLFNSDDLTKIQKMRFQIPTYWKEWLPSTESKEEKPQSSHTLGEAPSSTSKEGELPSPEESLPRLHHQERPQTHPTESLHTMANAPLHRRSTMIRVKYSHSSSSKHLDKPHSDGGQQKIPWKCVASPSQRPSSTEWAEKEPHLKGPSWIFNASSHSRHSSPSRHLSETDDQASFMGPNSTFTPNKTEGGPRVRSVSSNSRHSMTPFEMGLDGSFSIPSYVGVHHSRAVSPHQPVLLGCSRSPAADGTNSHHSLHSFPRARKH